MSDAPRGGMRPPVLGDGMTVGNAQPAEQLGPPPGVLPTAAEFLEALSAEMPGPVPQMLPGPVPLMPSRFMAKRAERDALDQAARQTPVDPSISTNTGRLAVYNDQGALVPGPRFTISKSPPPTDARVGDIHIVI